MTRTGLLKANLGDIICMGWLRTCHFTRRTEVQTRLRSDACIENAERQSLDVRRASHTNWSIIILFLEYSNFVRSVGVQFFLTLRSRDKTVGNSGLGIPRQSSSLVSPVVWLSFTVYDGIPESLTPSLFELVQLSHPALLLDFLAVPERTLYPGLQSRWLSDCTVEEAL